jgi:hypothetical protein
MRLAHFGSNPRLRASFWIRSAAITMLFIGAPHGARAISIRVSAADGYYLCTQNAPLFAPTRLYVSAALTPVYPTDPAISGIRSAEFRLAGLAPENFIVLPPQPAPGATLEGDPSGSGCRVSFASCQTWGGLDCSVPLLQIDVLMIQFFQGTVLVEPGPHFCQGMIASPLVTSCEDPATAVCATGVGVCINSSDCILCPVVTASAGCQVAVTPTTWSSLKALYKQ